MARPRRQVRAARERWERERRDRKFTTILGKFFGSVRASLCRRHLDEFQSFRDGLHEVGTLITDADPIVEARVFVFFPQFPGKIREETWMAFETWLRSDDGEPIRDICVQWCRYGVESQRNCRDCQAKIGEARSEEGQSSSFPILVD